MEVELAAVEEDVERKRVGKNPFDEKFTTLVRIPGFTQSQPNDSSLHRTHLTFLTTSRLYLLMRASFDSNLSYSRAAGISWPCAHRRRRREYEEITKAHFILHRRRTQ